MDIVGAAETGSGKTLAFGIPIVQGILQDRQREAGQGDEEVEAVPEPDDALEADQEDPPGEDEQAENRGNRFFFYLWQVIELKNEIPVPVHIFIWFY